MSILGEQLRRVRQRHGVTQRSLARRAGTTQAAISRIESGAESPSFERFTQLLLVLGERPILQTEPLQLDLDPAELAHGRRLTPEERLTESASWNLVATELEIAGAAARTVARTGTKRAVSSRRTKRTICVLFGRLDCKAPAHLGVER